MLNRSAVEMTLKLGQALGGKIAPVTFWARKSYFYPDLPKGYQISQSTAPVVSDAKITIDSVVHRIQRIHLEEDAGKLIHQQGRDYSLVDYNRAGVPLLEIVTYPDFKSADVAKRFAEELQRVVRHLKIADADMEKGQMRCEANVSVAPMADKIQNSLLGTKVEVKNINSFRALERAINYEFDRQVELLESGEKIVHQTRTWNSPSGKTKPMRGKETSADYRYFPEPDLPSVTLPKLIPSSQPLPEQQRRTLSQYGLSGELARLAVDRGWFELLAKLAEVDRSVVAEAVNLLVACPEFSQLRNTDQILLIKENRNRRWPRTTVIEIVHQAINQNRSIADVIDEFSPADDLDNVYRQVIENNPKAVSDYRSGKEAALHYLVGQVMAAAKGRADVQQTTKELVNLLGR